MPWYSGRLKFIFLFKFAEIIMSYIETIYTDISLFKSKLRLLLWPLPCILRVVLFSPFSGQILAFLSRHFSEDFWDLVADRWFLATSFRLIVRGPVQLVSYSPHVLCFQVHVLMIITVDSQSSCQGSWNYLLIFTAPRNHRVKMKQ